MLKTFQQLGNNIITSHQNLPNIILLILGKVGSKTKSIIRNNENKNYKSVLNNTILLYRVRSDTTIVKMRDLKLSLNNW